MPKWWDETTLLRTISRQTNLKETKVVHCYGRGGKGWIFKALGPMGSDAYALRAMPDDDYDKDDVDDSGCITIWVRIASPPRSATWRTATPITTASQAWFMGRRLNAAEHDAGGVVKTEGKGEMASKAGAEGSAPKRQRAKRSYPTCFEKQQVPGDGDCLFTSLALSISSARGQQDIIPKAQLKAQLLQYLNRRRIAEKGTAYCPTARRPVPGRNTWRISFSEEHMEEHLNWRRRRDDGTYAFTYGARRARTSY